MGGPLIEAETSSSSTHGSRGSGLTAKSVVPKNGVCSIRGTPEAPDSRVRSPGTLLRSPSGLKTRPPSPRGDCDRAPGERTRESGGLASRLDLAAQRLEEAGQPGGVR